MQRQHAIYQIIEFDRLGLKCRLDIQTEHRCPYVDRMAIYCERAHWIQTVHSSQPIWWVGTMRTLIYKKITHKPSKCTSHSQTNPTEIEWNSNVEIRFTDFTFKLLCGHLLCAMCEWCMVVWYEIWEQKMKLKMNSKFEQARMETRIGKTSISLFTRSLWAICITRWKTNRLELVMIYLDVSCCRNAGCHRSDWSQFHNIMTGQTEQFTAQLNQSRFGKTANLFSEQNLWAAHIGAVTIHLMATKIQFKPKFWHSIDFCVLHSTFDAREF